ncbi:unnamed protein product [Penicillium pancosmium]
MIEDLSSIPYSGADVKICLQANSDGKPGPDPSPATRVAVLRQQNHQSSVTYHQLDDSRAALGVLGYSYLRDIADQGNKQSPGKLHARIIQAYAKIHSLLCPTSESSSAKAKIQVSKASSVILTDRRCALIERIEPPPNSKADIVNTVFAHINLEAPTGPPLNQFVNCRSSNIKQRDLEDSANGISRPITISTGICLFSSRLLGCVPTNALLIPDNGTEITVPPLPHSTVPTLYELETCTRMATTIAGLVVTATTGGRPRSHPIIVRLDVPRLQYYCYPLELLQTGLVDWNYVQEWFELVDRRHLQVATLLNDLVTHEVRQRGCDVQVEITAGTTALTQLLRLCVLERRELPSIENMLSVLQRIGPDQAAWREFLNILDDCQKPRDLRSLALLAYVFEVIYPALQETTTGTLSEKTEPRGRPLIIQVDDIAEWRIFDRAEKLLKRFKQRQHGLDPLLVGVFPSPQIFTGEDQGRSTLFLHDPGQKIMDIGSSSSSGEGPRVVNPLDVIGEIYGREVHDTLERLIVNRGLCPVF